MKLQSLLAAMLYCRADQLPFRYDLGKIPAWFINDYLRFMLSSPNLFMEKGEADNYFKFMQEWVSYLYSNIFANPESKFWQEIAWSFMHNANFIPIYFNTANLKDIYSKRADIMAHILRIKGHRIDYAFPPRPANRDKIRVGILSNHFSPQTETYAAIPTFDHLDRNRFEIILYTVRTMGHPLEQYCQSRADRMVKLPDELQNQVQAIRGDDLDILLIGTNVTAVTHVITVLALHRLARIQLTSINSPSSTGMQNMDYYIGGTLTAPVRNMQDQYREKLFNIDGSALCFHFPYPSPPPVVNPTRADWGATAQTTVFISGANFFKIIPELRETWAKILADVPDSVLLLYPFNPNWTLSYPETVFVARMKEVFSRYGVDPRRLVVIKALPSNEDIKAHLKLADVYLDSFPYGGATSLLDPLSVNLPTLVMEGNALRFRQSSAMLKELQLPELVADTEESYIRLATALGKNPQLRQQYRERIRQNMANNPPFMDSRAFSAKIGDLFTRLFEEYQGMTVIASAKPVLSSEFSNLLIGCANLYDIDPSNASIVSQLRQVRRQLAEFWINTPAHQLENIYQGELLRGQRAVLDSGFKKEPLNADEGLFLQQLITELNQKAASNPADALNYLLAAMLYLLPDKLKIENADRSLPGFLIGDYKKYFESND
jgi:predicted O-linked N-acetylglucosamine transferase (SPINDLY family)